MEKNFLTDIRTSTNKLHDMAENTGFIKRLVTGNATVESYGEYIYNLYHVYKAIEDALEKCKDNNIVKLFAIKEVYRSEALLKDARFILGDMINNIELLCSTKSFVNRLNEISKYHPEAIIAHAYTRYLADLFGGRTIFKILEAKYNLPESALNYYIFDDIKDLKSFVMEYHNKLNMMDLNDDLKEVFLNETVLSYIYNIS
ncbi:heme oxygenase (biliverdin-producing), partial [Clostridium tarantellae]